MNRENIGSRISIYRCCADFIKSISISNRVEKHVILTVQEIQGHGNW